MKCYEDREGIEIEVVTDDGSTFNVLFDRHITWEHDSNYGADADNRRGESAYFHFEDSIYPWEVEVWANESWAELKTFPEPIQKSIMAAIEDWCEDNVPRTANPTR